MRPIDDPTPLDALAITKWQGLREFLHADDFVDAAVHLMFHYDSDEIINVGTGEDLTIAELAAFPTCRKRRWVASQASPLARRASRR